MTAFIIGFSVLVLCLACYLLGFVSGYGKACDFATQEMKGILGQEKHANSLTRHAKPSR